MSLEHTLEQAGLQTLIEKHGLHRCRIVPFDHQVMGIDLIVRNDYFFLADEMGAGKTKQAIDAAQVLFHLGLIDRVLVIAPASVRAVWFDAELGELAKHLWHTTVSEVTEFHARSRTWFWMQEGTLPDPKTRRMQWVITNYDFIRPVTRMQELKQYCTGRTLLILDESSAVKNYKAKQTKACLILRRSCGRVLLLNGTPIANTPMDLFSQGQIMSPSILECKTYFHFRARYAKMGGYMAKQIVSFQNLEDLQRRFGPYIIRRLKKDCLDLPEALPPVTLSVPLTEPTWKIYKEMRDDMVAWLSSGTVSTAQQAITKALRLAQITSGFLGGIDILNDDLEEVATGEIREIGREKLDFFLEWLDERLVADADFKLLVWCRFRPELARLIRTLRGDTKWLHMTVEEMRGGQKKTERDAGLRALDPRTSPAGPVTLGGTYGTGSMGHNFTAAHTAVNLSYDYSLFKELQSKARVDRPGQVHPVSYFDIVATGPQGQKTIDHHIVRSRRKKEDVATYTASAWIAVLTEE